MPTSKFPECQRQDHERVQQVGLAMMGISGNSFLNKPNFRYSGLNELPHSFRPSSSSASRPCARYLLRPARD